jgi:hypothetical protein
MDPVIISLIVFGSMAYVGGAVFCYCRVCRRDPLLDPLLDVSRPLDSGRPLDPSLRPLDSSRVSDTVDYSDIYPQTN